MSKRTFPSIFCKIGLRNTLFIFGRLMVVCCLFVCCFLQHFVPFWLTFFKIKALIELRKMFSRKKLFDVRLGNCSTPKIFIFCRFTGFTKLDTIDLTFKQTFFSKWRTNLVLYKLVLVTYPSIILGGFTALQTSELLKNQQNQVRP